MRRAGETNEHWIPGAALLRSTVDSFSPPDVGFSLSDLLSSPASGWWSIDSSPKWVNGNRRHQQDREDADCLEKATVKEPPETASLSQNEHVPAGLAGHGIF
jgi:hypothetical protein